MKKVITSLLMVFFAFFLFACNDELPTLELNVENCEEFRFDFENRNLEIDLVEKEKSFKLDSIKVPEGYDISFYDDNDQEITSQYIFVDDEIGYLNIKANIVYLQDSAINFDIDITIYMHEAYIKKVSSISVQSLKATYYLNEEFTNGLLNIHYEDNTTATITLTKDMVSNFDTTSSGNKTMTINYRDKTVDFSYLVLNEGEVVVTDIKVIELDNVYYLNDYFVPGILEVTLSDETVENISLTLDMIEGFDTETVGKKKLTITYEDLSIEYEIEVFEDLVLPDEEIIDSEIKEKVYKRFYVLSSGSFSTIEPSDIDKISVESVFPEMIVMIDSFIDEANITNEQLKKLINSYDTNTIYKAFNQTSAEDMSFILDKAKYEDIVQFLDDFKENFTLEQTAVILYEFFNYMNVDNNLYEKDKLEKLINQTNDDKIKAILEEKLKQLNDYVNKTEIISKKQSLNYTRQIYDLIDILKEVKHNDILNIMKIFNNEISLENTDEELFEVITSLKNISSKLIRLNVEIFEDVLIDFMFNLSGMGSADNMTYNMILTSIKFIHNLDLVVEVLNLVTIDSLKAFRFFLAGDILEILENNKTEAITNLKVLVKVINPIIEKARKDLGFAADLFELISTLTPIHIETIKQVAFKILELGDGNLENITEADLDKILDIIEYISSNERQQEYLIFKNTDYIFLKAGLTAEEAANLIIEKSLPIITDQSMNEPRSVTVEQLHLEDLNIVGYHSGYVLDNNRKYYFSYFVYESIDDFNYDKVVTTEIRDSDDQISTYIYLDYGLYGWSLGEYQIDTDDINLEEPYSIIEQEFKTAYLKLPITFIVYNKTLQFKDSKSYYDIIEVHSYIKDYWIRIDDKQEIKLTLDELIAAGLDINNPKLQNISLNKDGFDLRLSIIYYNDNVKETLNEQLNRINYKFTFEGYLVDCLFDDYIKVSDELISIEYDGKFIGLDVFVKMLSIYFTNLKLLYNPYNNQLLMESDEIDLYLRVPHEYTSMKMTPSERYIIVDNFDNLTVDDLYKYLIVTYDNEVINNNLVKELFNKYNIEITLEDGFSNYYYKYFQIENSSINGSSIDIPHIQFIIKNELDVLYQINYDTNYDEAMYDFDHLPSEDEIYDYFYNNTTLYFVYANRLETYSRESLKTLLANTDRFNVKYYFNYYDKYIDLAVEIVDLKYHQSCSIYKNVSYFIKPTVSYIVKNEIKPIDYEITIDEAHSIALDNILVIYKFENGEIRELWLHEIYYYKVEEISRNLTFNDDHYLYTLEIYDYNYDITFTVELNIPIITK